MKLKKLALQGYKTFATKTDFLFDEGITAVVGPNGSGKSNIADALRWVLGEQSYSTLRGKRTEDMIFAGSQTRPRAGMAQAVLTLDNSDGWLPIDFAEVEIGRRAYRSGENEYLLNGQRVRLKDVSELLATSGLSERTYTIIGQGLIDQALSLRADERRALFEEAAGINHYKARRAETLRRLTETQHNLERIHDILAEIKPRLSALKGQATRARNYEQIAQDLRQLLRIWYGYKWEQGKRELRGARETAGAAEQAWQQSRQALLVQQQNIDDVQRRINTLQQRLGEKQGQRDEIRNQLEKARREAAILQERRRALQRQIGDSAEELPALQAQRQAAEEELSAATAELTQAQESLRQQEEALQRFHTTFQARQAEINAWQSKLREAEAARRSNQTRLAQAEGQLSQLQERLKEQQLQPQTDEAEALPRLEKTMAQQTAVLEAAQSKADELRRRRAEVQQRRRALIDELKQLRRDFKESERQLSQARNQVARQEERADLLDQMRHKEVNLSQDVQTVGPLAALLTIPAAHRRALESALNSRLATLLLTQRRDLWALLEANAERAIAAAVLDEVRPLAARPDDLDGDGVIGWADEVVAAEAAAQPAVDLLLRPILLVKTREAAYRLGQTLPPGTLTVAPDGFVVHAGGLVQTPAASGQESILAREEAWREAQARLEQVKQDVAQAETAVAEQQETINERQSEVDRLLEEERRLGNLENESSVRANRAQREIDRVQQQQAFVQEQRAQQAREIARLQERIARLETEIAGYQETAVTLEASFTKAQTRLDDLPVAEGEQQRQSLQQRIASARTIVAGRQAVVDSRRSTLNQVEQQIGRRQKRLEELRAEEAQLTGADEESAAHQLQEQVTRLEMEITPLQKRLVDSRQELMALQEKTAALQRHAHELENQYTQTRVRLSQRENQVEGLQERIKADLGLVALSYDEEQTGATPLPLSELVEQLPLVEKLPRDIEENIHQYRGQLQRMGGVNPDAPTEYEETQARYDFLTQQVEDLNKTEAQLRRVIQELDELTSRAFAETVEKVNDVFGGTFTQLFGGGSARLVLTEPDDLTISGVDIIARLPNRREQGLALLSGGERSLTASALIFSLLKVSPTPFCVMDEVDAALDEANINRFRDLLRELSINTQFVIITHNRGTVQAAQTIYGVSMQPDSTSQVISIKPEEYVKSKLF